MPASPFRRAVPTTPADRTGARVDCFPVRAAFPVLQAGRHPHLYFRGLLRLYLALRPVELLNRPRRPLSRGFDPAGCPAKPLVSYQGNRQFPGWNLPPLVKRAFRGARRVEDGRGGLSLLAIAPFPIPAHQTGRADFPHPAFRLDSSHVIRPLPSLPAYLGQG